MTLVAVVNLSLDTQFLEHEHTTDTEHIFLLDAILPVTAIELVSDRAVKITVLVEVGIEQVKIHTSHVNFPDVGINHAPGIRHLENHLLSIFINHWFNGKVIEILRLVIGYLLSIHREGLGEIAIAIKETNSGHIDAAVTCLLDIVTGEDTQATRVYLESVAQSILHAEIGHRGDILAHGLAHIFLEVIIDSVDFCHKLFVFAKLLKLRGRHLIEHHHGVLTRSAPYFAV